MRRLLLSVAAIASLLPLGGAARASGWGVSMARDGSGNYWVVAQDGSEFHTEKYDSSGVFLSSAVLTGAVGDGAFNVAFDASGNAVVAGTSGGPPSLALWQVAASGDVLVASTTYSSAGGGAVISGGIAVDATGYVWVSGAEQTSEGDTYKFGLWKYAESSSPASGYPVYYQRSQGNLDASLATAMESSGNVWSVGVSSSHATGRLDLAVWKYDSSGNLASGFPVFWADAAGSVDTFSAAIATVSSGGVWVAANKSFPACPAPTSPP